MQLSPVFRSFVLIALAATAALPLACGGASPATNPPRNASAAEESAASPPAAASNAPTSPSASSAPVADAEGAPSSSASTAPAAKDAGSATVTLGEIFGPATFDVKTTLTKAIPDFRSCYVASLRASPGLHGKMTVSFVADESGKVTRVDPVKSTTNDPPLFECVKRVLLATTFPKPGGIATVTVPLKFRP